MREIKETSVSLPSDQSGRDQGREVAIRARLPSLRGRGWLVHP